MYDHILTKQITKKEKCKLLYAEGVKPKQIADLLQTSVGRVYLNIKK